MQRFSVPSTADNFHKVRAGLWQAYDE